MGQLLRRVYASIYLMVLYGPILLIVVFSFNNSIYVAFPLREFTLRWYSELAKSAGLLEALNNSLFVAILGSIGSTVIGVLAALAYTRYRYPGRTILGMLIFVPLALPVVVIGVALLSIFMLSGIGLSLLTVVLGHLIVCTPFAFGTMVSRMDGLNPDFELASSDLGERPLMTFLRVTVPLTLPGIIASLLLTFTISFDEFIISFFLSSNSPTLPVYMWSQMRFPDRLPMVLALATVILSVSCALIFIAQIIIGRNSGRSMGR